MLTRTRAILEFSKLFPIVSVASVTCSVPLSQTGDSVKRLIVSEYTLESRNEKASLLVTDLTTS